MSIRFQPIVAPIDCQGEDETEPVVLELTTRGDLMFHNWDRDADLAAVELGFDIRELPCLALEESWYALFDDESHRPLRLPPAQSVPDELYGHALEMKDELRERARSAIENSDYRRPEPRYKPFRKQHPEIVFEGLNPTGYERVTAQLGSVLAEIGSAVPTIQILYFSLETTVQAYMDVLDFIPSGLVWDGQQRLVVAAIDDVINAKTLIVMAGKQGHSYEVETRRALVRQFDHDDWLVEKWLR
jgi:hypothetical protein